MNKCSKSSKEVGNTKQLPTKVNPAKYWFFTLNNPTNDEIEELIFYESSIVPKYVFQLEEGENGTPHLQGIICFKKKTRPLGKFKCKRYHWEVARDVPASIIYCQKDEGRLKGPWVRFWERTYKVSIPDKLYKPWMKELEDILQGEPDPRKIYWYWEPKGCTGKTLFCKYIFCKYERVVVLSGGGKDMKNGIISYKETQQTLPRIILMNIPRSKEGFISWTGIEEIKDMFFYSGKYEGGMVCGKNPHIVIMANFPAPQDQLSKDRIVCERISRTVRRL